MKPPALRRVRAAGAAALCLAWVALAGPPLAAGPIGINADDISVDQTGDIVVASGHVAVAYGGVHAASDLLRFVRSTGAATFSGHVLMTEGGRRATAEVMTLWIADESRVTRARLVGGASVESPSYRLLADQVDADQTSRVLSAAGHVRVVSRPDLVVTGGQARYDEAADHADVRGSAGAPATIQNRDGRVSGSRLELWRKTGVAVVRGPVTAQISGATLRADAATIHLDRGDAVVTGHVRVVRRQGTLTADRLTIYYQARRFVAEGTTHLSLPDEDSQPP